LARRKLLSRNWDLVIALTDNPLRTGKRPVTAHASATEGVGLISIPALGATKLRQRICEAALNLIDGLVGESAPRPGAVPEASRTRVRDRLRELASPIGHAQYRDDGTIRFTTAVIRGNLRLLIGMVRANEPWQILSRLSKVLVAALGTAAYVFASTAVWNLAAGSSWLRLSVLTLVSLVAMSVTLIASHDLWERASEPGDRERVVLLNVATTITIAIGVASLYLTLFLVGSVSVAVLVPPDLLGGQIGQDAGLAEYVRLAWLGTSLALLAGALGSLVESDLSVREAAYGYRPDERTEAESREEERLETQEPGRRE